MRDQFDDLRKQMRDTSARLKRKQLNFVWDEPSPDGSVPWRRIWQVAYNERLTIAELHGRTRYCDWKIYQAAYWCVPASSPSTQNKTNRSWWELKNEKDLFLFRALAGRSHFAFRLLDADGERTPTTRLRALRAQIEHGSRQTAKALQFREDANARDATDRTDVSGRGFRARVDDRRHGDGSGQ